MINYQSGTTSADYYYDVYGLRVKKVVNGVRTYYIYDEGMLLGEISFDSSGQVLDERYYIYEPSSYYPLEMVVYESGVWKAYSYHNDHLMTPLRLTDENQEIVWSGNYSAFGEVEISVENVINNLRFPGQYAEKVNSFYYNNFRYYIPKFDRYNRLDPLTNGIEQDIILININKLFPHFAPVFKTFLLNQFSLKYIYRYIEVKSKNKYLYVNNNPILLYDISGLYPTNCQLYYGVMWGIICAFAGLGAESVGLGFAAGIICATYAMVKVTYDCAKKCEDPKNKCNWICQEAFKK